MSDRAEIFLMALTLLGLAILAVFTLKENTCKCECTFREPQTIFVEPDYE